MYFKYPRTYHLHWSEGLQNDDKKLTDYSEFIGKEIICTVKMDGENTSMYTDKIHARSLDSNNHESRNYVKGMWGDIRHLIPKGWRICGENMYAKHSIHYTELETYFYVFNIWDENNVCLSWQDTLDWCDLLDLIPVPNIYKGIYDEKILKDIALNIDPEKQEGYVIRTTDSFHYDDFSTHVAKYVRKNHVQTDEHWSLKEIIPNLLKFLKKDNWII